MGVFKGLIITTAIVSAVGGLVAVGHSLTQPASQRVTPRPSPEQIARKAADDFRWRTAVASAKAIKGALHDPDSVKWELIHVSEDAAVVCMIYRAKNAFGGYVREHISIFGGSASREARDWNQYCAEKPMHDLTHARQAL